MVKFASAARCTVAAILLAALHGSVVGAEVRVNGSADEVRVEAHAATPSEILAALRHHFALSYRGATEDHRVTQTFTGSLREVVKRVLDGYNYVIDRTSGVLVVTVVSPESSTGVAPPRPVPRGRQE